MTALTTPLVPSLLAQGFAAIGASVVRAGRAIADAWQHRRDVTVLATFDDRLLADIGLTRGDLNDAMAEPLWRDPTSVLARRYGERRRARACRAAVAALMRQGSPPLVPGPDVFASPPHDPPARLTL